MSRYKEWVKTHKNKRSEAILMREAIRSGQRHVVRSLLARHFIPNDRTLEASPLIYAIQASNAEIVRMLLDAGADPSFAGEYWFSSPLHEAASVGNADIVKLLLEHGADVNAYNDAHYGIMPLHAAILKGHADCVRLLLEHGAHSEKTFTSVFDDSQPNCTPLTMAIESGKASVVRALVQGGADVNAPNAAGDHPLCVAIKLGLQPVIHVLTEAPGLNPDAPDAGGIPGIFRLIAEHDTDAIAQLLQLGADPNAPYPTIDNTPLLEAMRRNQADTIELLLAHGATPLTDLNTP